MKRISDVLRKHEPELLSDWINQIAEETRRPDLMTDKEFRDQCTKFVGVLRQALRGGDLNMTDPVWGEMRNLVNDISRRRAQQGFTPSEVAFFILSFKKPLFPQFQKELSNDSQALAEGVWTATTVIDTCALWATEAHQQAQEEIIKRQQQEMLELSTPVVKLWEGILALPLIGTLDSARTQVVMESLLERIVETNSEIAIIDITGVPTVDTMVAQHLLKTVTAARLMGADCIISGIRPQIAQTIVHLGVTLDVVTKATLADAFRLALQRTGAAVVRSAAEPKS